MKKAIRSIIVLSILLFVNNYIYAQEIKWNNVPQKGFVYQISNDEAYKLLSQYTPNTIFEELLHTLVDTFDIKTGWLNRPDKGHFILAKIEANKLKCEYTCVFPYQVFLFKEYDALALQVLDKEGNVREDAIVKLKRKKLGIDTASKTYRLENSWFRRKNRITTVELEGFRSVFNITKHEVPEWYNNNNYDEGPDFYSYMITDKNKYKPGELIRFKSYALTGDKFPVRKKLEIWLRNTSKYIKVGHIEPHRPGSFAGEIQLHDSLNLVLDKYYNLQLRKKNGRIVSSCGFKYEDYELFGNKLDIKLSANEHYINENNELTITATDVNGLILKDAKASILIKTRNINESFQTVVILPDTLMHKQMDLDPVNPTIVEIPFELFQKTNTSYDITVTVLNSENERTERRTGATYYHSQYKIVSRFSNDSICFELFDNNVPMKNVTAELIYDNEIKNHKITFPYKEKINPAVVRYRFKNNLISKEFTLSHLVPELELTGGIVEDSFKIELKNPQKLDVSWYIYRGSELLKRGFGKEIDYDSLILYRTSTYYVELLYSFGGIDHVKRKQYVFKESNLNVSLDMPDRIFPGQEVNALIKVTNQLGDPVRNVDLTALAVTSKLNYYLPDLPYYGSSSSPRPKNDHFTKRDLKKRSAVLNLNYRKMAKLAGLDTMMYYKLIYPGSKQFKYSYNISDSTQFAPYVMQNGNAKNIYVIEVNRVPVYYSWTNNLKAYSFYVSPNEKKEITLRLHDRIIVLDSIKFEKGKKTIISIDLDKLPRKTKVHKLKPEFSKFERNRHLTFTSKFNNDSYNYAYLESNDNFTPLFGLNRGNSRYNNDIIAGPVKPGSLKYAKGGTYSIKYNHSGGYRYSFEDNVVYKQDAPKLLPKKLTNNNTTLLHNINDKVITKKQFLDQVTIKGSPNYFFNARTIDIVQPKARIKILLPYDSLASGIAAVLFEDCKTKETVSPYHNYQYNYRSRGYNIPKGFNNAIVLYNNGTYLKIDNIKLKPNIIGVLDFNESVKNPIDSVSKEMLMEYIWSRKDFSYYKKSDYKYSSGKTKYNITYNTTGNITGAIYTEDNQPLPGATVQIKGTTIATMTDPDGQFSIDAIDYNSTIVITYIGFETKEIDVTIGSHVNVQLAIGDAMLEEVVVVAYGVSMKKSFTGSVTNVSGEDLLKAPDDEIESEENKKDEEIIREAEQKLYRDLLTLNKIRKNFSDVGFWEPRLYTDKKGESKFKVTFPDDITKWDAVVYAMNRKAQTGTARKSIRSYKPLMAELHVPRFLTKGDSAHFLGKVLNYTSDSSIAGKINWKTNSVDSEKDIKFNHFHTDKLTVNAKNTDSITSRFTFKRDDGYFDGEERIVPVVEQGIIRADGTLSILNNNDSINVKASNNEKVTVEILANQLEIYEQEVGGLIHYRYACNEQLASKLIGLINHKVITEYKGKKFKYDRIVNKMIKRLLKNQNKEFLWSWWNVSENTSFWMSFHILRALKLAKDAGYTVNLSIENLARKAKYKFNIKKQYRFNDIDLLLSLANWNAELNYKKHLKVLDSIVIKEEQYYKERERKHKYYYRRSFLLEKFKLQEIRQKAGIPIQRDTILKYKKEGILGTVYFHDDIPERYWYYDKLMSNIIAYRIIRKDTILKNLITQMQMYFLSTRKYGVWNTYRSSNIISNVLPDLLKGGYTKDNIATVKISGKEIKTVKSFPYHVDLNPNEELSVKNVSGIPLFYQQYRKERVTKAKTGVKGFAIKTYFENNTNQLKAGEPIGLIVEVNVEKDAEFEHVMIEIPVPGACSYADKRREYSRIETHREYFKEKTVIFSERMKTGNYKFKVKLLPRFTGKYIINPAQVSLMYIPVVNANTDMKLVKVEDKD